MDFMVVEWIAENGPISIQFDSLSVPLPATLKGAQMVHKW
jgi:hypothetical protein